MTSYAEAQRLPRADRSDLSPAQTEIWDHVVETRKLDFMPNMFAVMGKKPRGAQGRRGRGRARPLALGAR